MIAQSRFEALRLSTFFPETDESSDPDQFAYPWEYMGGSYEFVEAPGCRFGYGSRTGGRLACLVLDSQGLPFQSENAARITKAIEFPFTLSDPIPAAAEAKPFLTHIRERYNPSLGCLELKGFVGVYHAWIVSDSEGLVQMIRIHNVEVVTRNCREYPEQIRDILHQFL